MRSSVCDGVRSLQLSAPKRKGKSNTNILAGGYLVEKRDTVFWGPF